jgi:hypothetical protein
VPLFELSTEHFLNTLGCTVWALQGLLSSTLQFEHAGLHSVGFAGAAEGILGNAGLNLWL